MSLIKNLEELSKDIHNAAHYLQQVMPAAGQAVMNIAMAVQKFAGTQQKETTEGLLKGTLPIYRAVNATRTTEGLPVRDFELKGLCMTADIPWAGKAAVIEYRRTLEAIFFQAQTQPASVPMFDGVNPGFDEKFQCLKARVFLAHGAVMLDVELPIHANSMHRAIAQVTSAWQPDTTFDFDKDSPLLGYSWVNEHILHKVAFQIWGGLGPDFCPLLADDNVRELVASYVNAIDALPEGGEYRGPYEEILFHFPDSLNPGKTVKVGVNFNYLPRLPEIRIYQGEEDDTPAHVVKNHLTRTNGAQTGGAPVKISWDDLTDIYKGVFFNRLQAYVKAFIEGDATYGNADC